MIDPHQRTGPDVPDTVNALDATDTIAAISTPPGRGGIGIVRLSGPAALGIAAELVRGSDATSLTDLAMHARARFVRVLDTARAARSNREGGITATDTDTQGIAETIDEALLTAFHAPHSYTGEDLVEIAAHGSPVVLQALLRGALSFSTPVRPVRLAGPGEFTQRAFLAGRLDLTQAEAVHDLIAAQTLDQARVAARQLGGALSRRTAPAKESLLHLIALLEAGMDFASGELDDVDVVPRERIAAAIAAAHAPLAALAGTFRRGQLMREGASIALVGPPNAGKSSLFNRLLQRERAIVTPLPGTTRDTVEESFALGGIPLRLIDTAGLREDTGLREGTGLRDRTGGRAEEPAQTLDEAERQGIARSREALADADVVVLVHDITGPQTDEEQALAVTLSGRPHVVVENKTDLLQGEVVITTPGAIRTSAITGAGLDQLRDAILTQLGATGSVAETGALNTLRQQESVTAALAALASADAANGAGLPHELLLVDLHTALRALDSLTGTTTADDILGRIFSTFCIGK